MRITLFCMLLLSVWSISGCATTGDPLERTLIKSTSVVSSGVNAGAREADTSDMLTIRARFNPCRCSTPDFELHVRGVWRRHILAGDEELLSDFQTQSEQLESTPGLHYFRLRGQFSGHDRFETGVEYPTFVVESFFVE